jgi:predicted O-linked N-acetylglucosamine transferase (SPINDLY family)
MEQSDLQIATEHHSAGRLAEAEAICRQILAKNPNDANALNLLGVIAGQTERPDAAIDFLNRAIQIQSNHALAHNNLGAVLQSLGRVDEAADSFRRAIQLNPNRPKFYYNLGNALKLKNQLDDAFAAYLRAIQLKPRYADAHNNFGVVLAAQGRLDDAISACRLALEISPDSTDANINLLYALYHHRDYDSRRLLEETRQWARRLPVGSPPYFSTRDRTSRRRLRIGYLSPFFGSCADAHFIFPLLAHHDRKQFEIFCYTRAVRDDELAIRMQTHCDHWHNIHRLGIAAAVDLIRSHQIDILINISRPADECMMIAANRVAPIQITWLTFASCTTGLETVDYRISDPHLDPPEAAFTEKTLHLPQTAWCYDPLFDSPPVQPLPALTNGYITFGSLSRFTKINPSVIATWAEILNSVPASRLHILAIPGSHRQRLLTQLQNFGIDPARIEFIDRLSRLEYMQQYDLIDITLDTFPFSGHTTALDSLWMGVPVVTLSGRTTVGRAASSALHNLGLPELIGKTPDEYVSIAVRFSQNIAALSELRASLRPRMQKSPLTDASRFAAEMEKLYQQICLQS